MNAKIKYYEDHIERKYKANVGKLKQKCKQETVLHSNLLADIEQIYRERAMQAKSNEQNGKNVLKLKREEYRAFYEGDLVGMEPFQSSSKEKVSIHSDLRNQSSGRSGTWSLFFLTLITLRARK